MYGKDWLKKQRKKERKAARKKAKHKRNGFYYSHEWKLLRYAALEKSRGRCECCGASSKEDGIRLMVDHIKPISRHPELASDPKNLQVLCASCNWGKMARFKTDWRSIGLDEEPFDGILPA